MKRLLALASLILIVNMAGSAHAETLAARVVGITDGDTITVLAPGNVQYRIRLAGIDAPERRQPFGTRSRQNLSRLVFGKTVTLDCGKKESYNRKVCKVMLEGRDICLAQVEAGMAWHYKQFQNEQTPRDRKLYAEAEDRARRARIGLFTNPHAVPPWDRRHGTRTRLCFNRAGGRIACSEKYHGPVRGNRRSHIFQWPGCPYYDAISPANRVTFPNREAAVQAGYRAARNCP